jgi:hypothetical protein
LRNNEEFRASAFFGMREAPKDGLFYQGRSRLADQAFENIISTGLEGVVLPAECSASFLAGRWRLPAALDATRREGFFEQS